VRVYWINQFSVTPNQPGGTRHYDMARELCRHGHDVLLLASDLSLTARSYSRRRGPWDLKSIEESVDGVQFIWLPAGIYTRNDWRRLLSMVIFSVAVFFRLIRVPCPPPTVFIGSSPHLFGALATWAAASMRRAPFVLEVRDLWPESYTDITGRRRGAFVGLLRIVADFLYRRADEIIVFTPENIERVAGRGIDAKKIRCIPNGVDLSMFNGHAHNLAETVVFVYAGAHGPANGLEVILQACEELRKRGVSNWHVILVGDGPSKTDLMAHASRLELDQVEFRVPVPKQAIADLFSEVDVALMILAPAELFASGVSPNKLFDYLAADLPIVNNVPGGVADIIAAAGSGITCSPGDPVALASAIEEMMKRLRRNPGSHRTGRAYVAIEFDRQRLSERLRDLLLEVVAARGQPGR
jgi:glycosyltransferase involved in cell wall biosynthesis